MTSPDKRTGTLPRYVRGGRFDTNRQHAARSMGYGNQFETIH